MQNGSKVRLWAALLLLILFILAGNSVVVLAANISYATTPLSHPTEAKGTTADKPNSAEQNSAKSSSIESRSAESNSNTEPVVQMFAVQDSKLNVVQEVLPNGLKVIVLEDHSFPTVTCQMWYHVGSSDETPGLSGMSHLVEHMLFKDAGIQKPGDIPLTLARIGADFNGYTSQDFTAFYETLPATRLELALRIEAARMCNVHFTQNDINEELKRIAKELELKKSDPDSALSLAVHTAAYQVHPYRIPTSGWPTDARNLNAGTAKNFYDRYYVPNNASLVIVGNVTCKNALKLVQQYFGSLPKSATIRQDNCPVTEPPQNGLHSVAIKSSSSHQILQLAYHAPAISDPDAPAMAVIESLLNTRCTGGLSAALIHDRLCSNVISAFELRRDPGLFVISLSGVNGSRQKATEVVDATITNLRGQSLSEQDLKRAKNSAEFSFVSKLDSPYRVGFDLGYFDTISDWRSAFSWPRRLQTVSSADVQRAANKYLDPDTRVVGWAGLSDVAPNKTQNAKTGNVKTEDTKTGNAKAGNSRTGGAKNSTPSTKAKKGIPKKSIEKIKQAQMQRVPVLCFQLNSSPSPPGSYGANGKTKELTGSASKTEFENQSPATAKYATSIANKLSAIQSRSLSNGLRLVVFESHLSPVVQITGAIEAGQIFDPTNKKGLSELTAANFNAGSITYPKNQMMHIQEDLGISPNAMLRFEPGVQYITFHSLCLRKDLKTQLELLGGVLSPTISPDMEIDRFKASALSTLKQDEDSITACVNRALLQNLVAPKSPYYPVSPCVRAKMITGIKAGDLKTFHDKYVAPSSTVIVIAGDTTLDESAQILEKALANWTVKSGVAKAPRVELSTQHILRTSIPLRDGNRSLVCLGQLMDFGTTSSDYVNLLAAGCALTEHPVLSRLGLDLNQEEPVVANTLNTGDISSSIYLVGDHIAWSLNLAVQPDVVSRTVRALLREAKGLSKGGLSPVEVVEIKRYLAGAVPVHCLADINSVSKNILDSTLQSNWPDFYQPLLTGVYSLSADSLNKFLHEAFRPDRSTIVVAARADTIRTLRKQALSAVATSK